MFKKTLKLYKRAGRYLIGVALVVVPLIYLIRLNQRSEAAWFDDSYAYRTPLTINNSGAADSNKKVKFDIDTATLITAGKMQSDCGDSRFTDINGAVLRYYLDSAGGACNGASTDYYVLIPTINSGTTIVYHYYGNPEAANGTEGVQFSESTFTPSSTASGTEEKGQGPVLYWSMSDAKGTTVNDSSSYNNDGTITGAVWKNQEFCPFGNCLYFDNSGDYVSKTYSSDSELDPGTGSFSVTAWFKHSSTAVADVIIARFSSGGYKVYMQNDGTVCFGIDDDATFLPSDSACSTTTYHDSRWHHVAGVKSGASSITLYIDGLQVATDTSLADPNSLSGSSPTFYVGIDSDASTNLWDGYLDEVKYYNFALSAAQVKAQASSFSSEGISAGFGSVTASNSLSQKLLGYWKLDETSGNRTDSSENVIHMTAVNGTPGAAGKFGNAADFESGSSQCTRATDNSVLSVTGSLTLTAWVNPESVTASTQFDIIGKMDGANESYLLAQYGDELRLYIDSSSNYAETTSANLATGSWHHVAGVYDASQSQVKIYVNGVLSPSTVTGTIPNSIGDDAGRFHIGCEDTSTSASNFYDGLVDDARLYGRALTQTEIDKLYTFSAAPIGWWKMDEGAWTNDCSTDTVFDYSANERHGDACPNSTGPTSPIAGKFGNAGSFDGSNDYVQVADHAQLDFTGDFTLSAWVNRLAGSGAQIISKTNDSSDGGYALLIGSSGEVYCRTNGGAASNNSLTATGRVTASTGWVHVSAVKTGSSCRVFVNGVDATATADTHSTLTANTNNLTIGTRPNAGGEFWNGLIDDVKVYDYARNAKQVVEDMNAGHPAGGSPVSSPIIHWRFDEANSTTANNSNSLQSSLSGSISGASWLQESSCRLNPCLNVDTNTDDISAGDTSFTDGLSGMTVSMYINPQTLTTNDDIISKSNTNQQSFRVITDSSSSDEIRVFIASSTTDVLSYYLTSNLDLTGSTWVHLAIVYDGSLPAANRVTVYKNGRPVSGSIPGNALPASMTTGSTSNLKLGESDIAAAGGLLAYYDELKIYNYALSQGEVLLDMNAGSSVAMGGVLNPTHSQEDFSVTAPVAWWKLDEGSGATANDSSGNGYTGTITSPLGGFLPGKIGSGLELEGSSRRVSIGDVLNFGNTDNFTLEGWVYLEGVAVDNPIVAKRNSFATADAGYVMYVDDNNDLRLEISDGTNEYTIHGTTAFAVDKWYHVVAVVDEDSETNTTLYVNGMVDEEGNTGNLTSVGSLSTASELRLGATASGGNALDGYIDNIRIYNYALTQTQVAYIFNRGAPSAWWRFDECQGTTAYDASIKGDGTSGGKNGTINIGATVPNTTAGNCTSGNTAHAWYNGATGKFNSSLDLDGADDYVQVSDTAEIDFERDEPFSLGGWVKTSSTDFRRVIGKLDTSPNFRGYALSLDDSSDAGEPVFQLINTSGSNAIEVNGNQSVNDGNWHHVFVTYSGSSNASGVKIFVDAKQVSTTTQSNTLSATILNNSHMQLGGCGSGCASSTQYFDGLLDDLRIYNYELIESQIRQIYNHGAVKFGPAEGSP